MSTRYIIPSRHHLAWLLNSHIQWKQLVSRVIQDVTVVIILTNFFICWWIGLTNANCNKNALNIKTFQFYTPLSIIIKINVNQF